MRSSLRIIEIATVIVLLTLGIGLTVANQKRVQKIQDRCTEAVGGKCVTCVYHRGNIRRGKNRSRYHITASYKVNGVTLIAEGQSERPYSPGDDIGVHYDPADPSVSYTGSSPIKSDSSLPAIMAILTFSLGVIDVFIRKRGYIS